MTLSIGELVGYLTLDDTKFRRALADAERNGSRAANSITNAGKVAGKALAVGLAVGGAAAVKVTKDAAQLDTKMREVVTLFGETGKAADKSLGTVQKDVRRLSDEFGFAQETLTAGLYSAISAGVPRENAFTFMQVASQAAVAGVTDVETTVDGLTTTINAFGLKASDAQAVSDSMFAAVKGGKTTFQELSDSMFNVAPAAAAAGVKFTEVNAAIATLTAGGTPTSVATTQIRAALTGLQKPSKELDAIFQALGYRNAQVAVESKGLGFALDAVKKASGGNNGELQKLLGSTEAVSAANVLAGTGAKKFADEMKNQAKASGSTAKAYEVVNEGAERQYQLLTTRARNLGLAIGQQLLPVMLKLTGALTDGVAWVDEHQRLVGIAAAAVIGLTAALWLASVAIRAVRTITIVATAVAKGYAVAKTLLGKAAIGTRIQLGLLAAQTILVTAAQKAATLATKGMAVAQRVLNAVLRANPIGIVITVLAALAAAVVVAYKKSETFRNIVDGAWKAIQKAASIAWNQYYKPILGWLGGALKKAWETFGTFRKTLAKGWDLIQDKAKTATLWLVDKVLWMAERILGAASTAFGWAPDIGEKLKAAHEKVQDFRRGVNAELDAMRDEEVKIRLTPQARSILKFTHPGLVSGGAGSGGVGGAGHAHGGHGGGYGGSGITPRVEADRAGLGRAVKLTESEFNALTVGLSKDLSAKVSKSLEKGGVVGPMGKAGRVLPRGSYSIGMPYLGYPGHYGADYPAPAGTPVHAVASGIVSRALSLTTSYGKHAFIDHAGGRQSRYAHLSSLLVQAGQAVRAGQMIGRVGSTGNSTGDHLHYEDRVNGVPRNPAKLGIFDTGGLARGAGLMVKGPRPERVLSPRQTEWFEQAMKNAMGGAGGRPIELHQHFPTSGDSIAALAAAPGRVAAMLSAVGI